MIADPGISELTGFDRPLFKKLSNNDTGVAAGHQGGLVIPKELDKYFPQLAGKVSAANPTIDERIIAELVVNGVSRGVVSTRYQFQTWGGTRSPERRLTSNLSALRNAAAGGDYLIIERSLADPSFYRLQLLKTGTPEFNELQRRVGPRSWGPVDRDDQPVTEPAIRDAFDQQMRHEIAPLVLFDNASALTEIRTKRISRSRAFQLRISELYEMKCAVCGQGLRSPLGLSEIESAHIVPRSQKGADDARNGLALCRSHHWAFDRGLFGVDTSRQIAVFERAASLTGNSHLLAFDKKALREPNVTSLAPAEEALLWHRTNVVGRY